MNNFWLTAQIVIAILIITSILLQSQGGGIGPAFGGGESYHTRRGIEKVLFNATIVLIVLFAIVSIASLITH